MVTGVNITERQLDVAKSKTKKYKLQDNIKWILADYSQTNLHNESFDFVWLQESMIHSYSKSALLSEASRILKKGGKIIIADTFVKRTPTTEHEKLLIKNFIEGWALKSINKMNEIINEFVKNNIKIISNINETKSILPSLQRMKNHSLIYNYFDQLLLKLGMVRKYKETTRKNAQACLSLFEATQLDLLEYRILLAQKDV